MLTGRLLAGDVVGRSAGLDILPGSFTLRYHEKRSGQQPFTADYPNQHQNIVQQQNLIAGQGAQISELTKLCLLYTSPSPRDA